MFIAIIDVVLTVNKKVSPAYRSIKKLRNISQNHITFSLYIMVYELQYVLLNVHAILFL